MFLLKALVVASVLFLGWHLRLESVQKTVIKNPIRADATEYFSYAWNLKYKGVYSAAIPDFKNPSEPPAPDAMRSPGYPLYLSLFVKEQPDFAMVYDIYLSQAGLSLITLACLLFVALQILSFPWAIAAAVFTALSPHLIVANSYVLTETFFCFFLVLFMFGWVGLEQKGTLGWALLVGFLLGCTALVRPGIQYFVIPAAILLLVRYGRSRWLRITIAFAFGFALTVGPWVIRNAFLGPEAGNRRLMINFIHHGMYPELKYRDDARTRGFPYVFDPRAREIGESVSNALSEIRQRFRNEPKRYLRWYLIGKPTTFWSWNMIQGQGGAFVYPVAASPYYEKSGIFPLSMRLMFSLHWVLVVLAGVGTIGVWWPVFKHRKIGRLDNLPCCLSLLLIYFTAIHMVGTPLVRYAIPLKPMVYVMAMFCLANIPFSWRSGRVDCGKSAQQAAG